MGNFYSDNINNEKNINDEKNTTLNACIEKSNQIYECVLPYLNGYIVKKREDKFFFRVAGPNALFGVNISIPPYANENVSENGWIIETSLWHMKEKRIIFSKEFNYEDYIQLDEVEILDEIRRVYNITILGGYTIIPVDEPPGVTFIDGINWLSTASV